MLKFSFLKTFFGTSTHLIFPDSQYANENAAMTSAAATITLCTYDQIHRNLDHGAHPLSGQYNGRSWR
jgi:hypothetical protein